MLGLLPHPRVLGMVFAAILAGRSAGTGPLDFQLMVRCVFRAAICVLLLRYEVPLAQAIFMACARARLGRPEFMSASPK